MYNKLFYIVVLRIKKDKKYTDNCKNNQKLIAYIIYKIE